MPTSRSIIPVVLLASVIVGLAGCGDDDSSEPATTSTVPTTATTASTQPFFGVGELHASWSTGHGTGSGIASPIGEWTYEVEGTTAGSTKATGTITDENGDQLFVDITTTIVPDVPPPNARNRFVMEITGGTGEYEHASGEVNGEVQEQKVEGSTVDATFWWNGTITY